MMQSNIEATVVIFYKLAGMLLLLCANVVMAADLSPGTWTPLYAPASLTVHIPQGAYRREMLEGLSQLRIPVRELSSERVMALKGTSVVALLGGASGVIETAERPGVAVFADGQP
jgi:hypothetical protein